jgi:tetratricopeptide (TPR) repeat protein
MYDMTIRNRTRFIACRRIGWASILAIFLATAVGIPKSYSEDATFEEASAYFGAGKLDEAAAAFQQILSRDPENREAAYNLGLCLLNMGKADSAAAILDRVANSERLKSELRRDVLYNLGLAKAHTAQARAVTQPGEAKDLYAKSIEHFRDALAYSSGEARFRMDTGYNIEAAGRLLEQLEHQMQQQQSPSASDSLADEVQDLAQDQEQLRNQTQESQNPDELADQQQKLSERASQLAEEMQRRGMDEPAENMTDAQEAQERAAEELNEKNAQQATESQEQAMEELREALAQLLQQAQEGEESEERQAPSDAKEAAEELARLRHEAEKEKEKREEDLRRRGYRPPVTERVEVEKNW